MVIAQIIIKMQFGHYVQHGNGRIYLHFPPVAFRRRLLRRQPKPDIQPHFSPIKCGAQSEFIGMKIITSIITLKLSTLPAS